MSLTGIFLFFMAKPIGGGLLFYVVLLLVLSDFISVENSLSSQDALMISTFLAVVEAFVSIFFGWLTYRCGLRSVLFLGALAMALLALPLFYLVTLHHFWITLSALRILSIVASPFDGPVAACLVNQFDVSVRHSGVSLSCNGGGAVIGGLIPVILTYFIDKTHLAIFPSFLLIGFSLLAIFILWREKGINAKKILATFSLFRG